jgi:hypothetical protein
VNKKNLERRNNEIYEWRYIPGSDVFHSFMERAQLSMRVLV